MPGLANQFFLNNGKPEKDLGWAGAHNPFLTTNHTNSHENFYRVAALTDEIARRFVIWPIGFSD